MYKFGAAAAGRLFVFHYSRLSTAVCTVSATSPRHTKRGVNRRVWEYDGEKVWQPFLFNWTHKRAAPLIWSPDFLLCVAWLHVRDTSCGCGWAAHRDREVRWKKTKKQNKKRLHRTSQYVSYVFLRITTLNNSFCSEGWRRFSGQEIIIGKQTRRRSGAVNDWL